MLKTKVTEKVYFFTDNSIFKDESNASIILTEDGPVIIDTFGTPKHYEYISRFLNNNGYEEPQTVIYTHGHLDHVLGNQVDDPNYSIYGHNLTRKVMDEAKVKVLPKIIEDGFLTPDVNLVYPTVTFDQEINFKVGSFIFNLIHTPGHSEDSITIFEKKTKIAFVGDNFIMFDGLVAIPKFNFEQGIDSNDYLRTFNKVKSLNPSVILQGHGALIEPNNYFTVIDSYIETILSYARKAVKEGKQIEDIETITYQEVIDDHLAKQIWGLDTQYSTFRYNITSAFKHYQKVS